MSRKHHAGRFRGYCASVAVIALSACTQWSTDSAPLPEVIAKQPKAVRVQNVNGQVLELRAPRLEGDSLRGFEKGSAPPGMPLPTSAIAVNDIRHVARPQTSMFRTVAAILAVPLALGSVYVLFGH